MRNRKMETRDRNLVAESTSSCRILRFCFTAIVPIRAFVLYPLLPYLSGSSSFLRLRKAFVNVRFLKASRTHKATMSFRNSYLTRSLITRYSCTRDNNSPVRVSATSSSASNYKTTRVFSYNCLRDERK